MRLDAVAKAKEDALAFSQQTLEEDAKKFEDYLQERISKASNATMLGGTSGRNWAEKFGANIWFPNSGYFSGSLLTILQVVIIPRAVLTAPVVMPKTSQRKDSEKHAKNKQDRGPNLEFLMFTLGTPQLVLSGSPKIRVHYRSAQDKVQKIKSLKQQIAAVHSDTGKLKEVQ